MKKLASLSTNQILLLILAASVLARVAAAIYLGNTVENMPGTTDQISYHTLALRLINGHGFTFGENWWPATQAGQPTAHWSYLYSFFLAGVYSLFGPNPLVARLLQAVLIGILQPLLVYWIGSLALNRLAGLVGAALTAVYAYFVYYGASLMTEALFIPAVLAALYFGLLLVRRVPEAPGGAPIFWLAVGLGLASAAAILLRQLFLLFLPFLFAWILWYRRRDWLHTSLALAVSAALVILAILPFTFFNRARFDQFVLLNTNAGFAFYWANHPVYGTQFEPILSQTETVNYRTLLPKELAGMDEAELDSELLKRGLQFVIDEPGRYALLSLSRIPGYFMFWPSASSGLVSNITRVASFGLAWPFMLYGLILAFRRSSGFQFRFTGLLLLFCLVYTAIHILTWALVRYRLPVDAVLLPFAGLALVDLAVRLLALRRRPQPSLHAS